jgi:sugar phosphate isomerase/epimerase
MKLGVAGLLGDGSRERIGVVRRMGFSAASWHLPDLRTASDEARLLRVREAAEEEQLELCQLLPPQYPSLADHDSAVRAAGVEAMRSVLQAARVLRAGSVYVRPGSLNPAGPWTPHPENHAPETRARLVESLRLLAPAAEALGVPLALEGHVVSPLYSPEVVREVIDAVNSPMLCFNADPVNLISTLDEAYDSTALIDRIFDLLGDRIVAAHAKDVTVADRLVVHIDECVPGQGYLDHETFLRRFEQACPRGVVLIEHLPEDRVPEARRAMLDFASRAGLRFEEAA